MEEDVELVVVVSRSLELVCPSDEPTEVELIEDDSFPTTELDTRFESTIIELFEAVAVGVVGINARLGLW